MKDRDEQRQTTKKIRKKKNEREDFFVLKADELMRYSTRSVGNPFQEIHKKREKKEREIRPSDWYALKEIGGLNDS